MARYAPEFMDSIRRPRPLAHIRDPHNLHRSRQHRDSRPDDRDRNLDRIGDGAVEVRIVNDIIDDHPDHPININFNYGPVHFHQTCGCPNPAAHTCIPFPTPGSGRGGLSRRNTLTYRDPPYPSDRDSPSPRPPHRPRPPPSNPPPPPRLRSILRNRDASGPVNPRAVIVPSSGSSSSSSAASTSDLDDSETTTRVRRTTTTTTVVLGICDGCLTRQRLVADGLCAECAYFARDAPPPRPPPGSGGGAGGVSLYSGRPRPAPRPRSMGAWGGGNMNGANGVGVRYVPMRGEDADVAAARREVRERERWREAELEMRERERARERERERERESGAGRRGVRWVREVGVRDGGLGRERRYYSGGPAEGAYYTESDLDDW